MPSIARSHGNRVFPHRGVDKNMIEAIDIAMRDQY
jgi:hypothetical protein